MDEEYCKHLLAEIHELNGNIVALAGQIEGLKKYLTDLRARIVWVQQKMGLRRMPSR